MSFIVCLETRNRLQHFTPLVTKLVLLEWAPEVSSKFAFDAYGSAGQCAGTSDGVLAYLSAHLPHFPDYTHPFHVPGVPTAIWGTHAARGA